MSEPQVVGFVGLGNMGGPMSARLVGPDRRVQVFDLSEAARAAAAAAGAVPVGSAADAARDADVVVLMLPDSTVVEKVVTDTAFLDALSPGATVVDMSSSEPGRTRTLAATLAEHGVAMVDAPVSGGVAKAGTGELAVMVGGADDDVRRVTPVLARLGRVFPAGPIGAGHAVKALNNLMSATHLLVTSEAMLAGIRFGLDPEVMLEIVNSSSGRSGSTENKWPNFVVPETYDSGFGLRLMLKDMRIAARLAAEMQSPGGLGDRAVELWARAAEALPADADHTEIVRWLRAATPGPEGNE